MPTTRIDRDGRRLLYQLSPLHFSPPTTSLLSDEDMCMCIHNKPVGCLAGPSLSPPDSKVIRPLSGRCLRPPATASHFAPRRLSIFVGLDGEYLEPFCKAERRASSPSPSLPGSGYDSSAGCCLDPDASRGPLSRAARARAPASHARTWLSKDAIRPRLAAALLRPKGRLAAAAPHVGRALGYAPAGTTSWRGSFGKMCPPRASTETGEDCSTSSRLYIFPRPPLPC